LPSRQSVDFPSYFDAHALFAVRWRQAAAAAADARLLFRRARRCYATQDRYAPPSPFPSLPRAWEIEAHAVC